MNIVLWFFQIVVALYSIMGAVWRILNYDQAANEIPSVEALSKSAWITIGAFEIVCAIGLILPGLLRLRPKLTIIAALCLSIEMFLITVLHANYFGFQFQLTNPAIWTMMLCLLAAFIAYGRYTLKSLEPNVAMK